jgi:hypothetical protein
LLQQSETFSNAYWTKLASTITADAITAPNGTTTADQLFENVVTAPHGVAPSSGTNIVLGQSYTASMYVKKGNRIYCGLEAFFNTTNGAIAFFNIDSGTLLYQFAQGSGYSVTNSSITNVGNDWYLLRATFTLGASPAYFGVCIASTQWTTGTSYNNQYAGDTSKFIYIWGAQLVEGSFPRTYFPTTDRLNVPRLSYEYGSAPALLLEPQRTNLVLQSESFDSVSWSKIATSITANSTISPDNTNNADLLIENTSNAVRYVSQQLTKTASSLTYAFSVYYKNGTGTRKLVLAITNGTSSGKGAIFTTSGTLTASDLTIGTGIGFSMTSANVISVGNGWYRANVVVSTDTATRVDSVIYLTDSTTTIGGYIGDGTSGIFIYGAQLELGAYSTTYIPTVATTATRLADSFTRGNIYTNGLITAAGGTWFIELRNNISYTRDSIGALWIGDNSTAASLGNSLNIRSSGTGILPINKCVGGTLTQLHVTTTSTVKIAIKWNGTTADVFVNGVKVTSATSFTTTNMEFLNGQGSDVPKFVQQMVLFPIPLSDDQCVALTSDFTEGESVIGSYERYVNSNGGAVENLNTITNLIQNLK